MASLRFLLGAPALFCFLGACTIKPNNWDNSAPTQPETGEVTGAGGASPGVAGGVAGAKNSAHAGAAGRSSVKADGNALGGSAGEDNSQSDAGEAGANATGTEPTAPCDLKGNCSSACEDDVVTCGVISDNECEFQGFVGATTEVSCGQPKVVGTACCGACGCVPVEVYFDGLNCWQGIPQCSGQLFRPHAATVPNPSFSFPPTAPGTAFYLGSGGMDGATVTSIGGSGGAAAGAGGAPTTPAGGGSSAP